MYRGFFRFCRSLQKIFFDEGSEKQAAALTFTTLLALVPLMTISVAIFSAFPAFDELKLRALKTVTDSMLPEAVSRITTYFTDFMTNAGQMTVFGIVALALTSLLLMATIESSFNKIWHVSAPRSLMIRILAFWAVLTLAPIFIALSIALSDKALMLANHLGFDTNISVWQIIGVILPLLFETIGFTLLYMVVPHKKVYYEHALIGGAVSAFLLELSKFLFSLYLEFFPVYQTVYGAVSAIPIFLIWLYIVWLVVLLGAMIAAHLPNYKFYSHAHYQDRGKKSELLGVMLLLLQNIVEGCRKNNLAQEGELRAKIGVPSTIFDEALERLHYVKMIMPSKGQVWVVSCDIANFTIFDVCRLAGFDLAPSLEMIERADPPVKKDLFTLLESGQNRVETLLSKPLSEVLV